jgi:hypothetical protein
VVDANPPESGDPTAEAREHRAHVFDGWDSFLRHLREDHRVDPPTDDGEAWLVHEGLHPEGGALRRRASRLIGIPVEGGESR